MKLSTDLRSPGSRQLLQLQLFPKFFKFWTILLISFFLGLFGLLNSVFVLLQIGIVWSWSEVNCFHAFQKTAIGCQCFGLWSLKLIWKWCPLIWMISFITIGSLSEETLVLFAAAISEVKQIFSIASQSKVFRNLTYFYLVFRRSVKQ